MTDNLLGKVVSGDEPIDGGSKDSVAVPLVVDLDGTLIRSDLLMDGFAHGVATQPLAMLRALLRLGQAGKAGFKVDVAEAVSLDVSVLPYDQCVVEYIRQARATGRRVVLATAANRRVADQVAAHLGLFDDVLASDDTCNLAAEAKAERIAELLGTHGFEYLGNGRDDLAVWRRATRSIAVNPNLSRAQIEREGVALDEYCPRQIPLWAAVLRGMRLYQWAKNGLVFAPLVLAHQVLVPDSLIASILAFLLLGMAASAVYLLNDVLDIQADRHHPRKSRRVIAAGHLPIPVAVLVAAVLVLLSVGGAVLLLPLGFVGILLGYLVLATAYSLVLKRVEMLDVLTLAGLFTLRIAAGGLATGIEISHWLASFSMFFFVSLAFLKRYIEVWSRVHSGQQPGQKIKGRGYRVGDEAVLITAGIASGYVSVLVLALYVSSEKMQGMYQLPWLLWAVPVVVLYWLSRAWHLAHRGKVHDDPVVFALTDRGSLALIALTGLLGVLAI